MPKSKIIHETNCPAVKNGQKGKMNQVYFSLQEIALYLGLSPKTIYAWVENGEIPAYKFGRVWRFSLTEVEAFVRSCYNSTASEKVGEVGTKKEIHRA